MILQKSVQVFLYHGNGINKDNLKQILNKWLIY